MMRLGPSDVTSARAFLGIDEAIPEYERMRAHRRFRCALPMRFLRPSLSEPSMVMNLSEGGLLAHGGKGFVKGEHLEVSIETAQGPIVVEAEVQWHLGTSVGLRFVSIAPEAHHTLHVQLEVLREREQAQKIRKLDPVWVVADRDPDACQRMAKWLTTLGARTLAVQDGRELISLCRAMHPDLVFVDVLLHGIDGPQACRQLRSEQDIADTPLVLTGQLPEHELQLLSLHEGANDFLVKPAQAKDVAAVMRRLLGIAPGDKLTLRV